MWDMLRVYIRQGSDQGDAANAISDTKCLM